MLAFHLIRQLGNGDFAAVDLAGSEGHAVDVLDLGFDVVFHCGVGLVVQVQNAFAELRGGDLVVQFVADFQVQQFAVRVNGDRQTAVVAVNFCMLQLGQTLL